MPDALVVVEQVALYLGSPWKFNRRGEDATWRLEIIDGMGRGLWFRFDSHKDRFDICGRFPGKKTAPIREDHKSIGVSAARPAKDIARDIRRRLLPHYSEAYDRAVARYRDNQKREEHLTFIAEAVTKVTNGRLASQNERGRRTVYFDHGEAHIWSSGDVHLELRALSADKAIQIAAMFCSKS